MRQERLFCSLWPRCKCKSRCKLNTVSDVRLLASILWTRVLRFVEGL